MFHITFSKLFILASLLLFSACGGGSSSSDTATGNTTNEQNNFSSENENSNSTTVTISAGADRTVKINTPIMIIGEVLGDKNQINSYEWKSNEDVLATTLKFEYVPTQIGTQILTLIATTNSGEQLQDSMSLEVREEYTIELLPF